MHAVTPLDAGCSILDTGYWLLVTGYSMKSGLPSHRESRIEHRTSSIEDLASRSAPTACRHTVSCSISLPFRGSFHLSLAVLVRYRSPGVFSLRRWSSRIHTGFLVSRVTWGRQEEVRFFSHTRLSLSTADRSRSTSAKSRICNFPSHRSERDAAPQPPENQ